jgi:hypothetical protein
VPTCDELGKLAIVGAISLEAVELNVIGLHASISFIFASDNCILQASVIDVKLKLFCLVAISHVLSIMLFMFLTKLLRYSHSNAEHNELNIGMIIVVVPNIEVLLSKKTSEFLGAFMLVIALEKG